MQGFTKQIRSLVSREIYGDMMVRMHGLKLKKVRRFTDPWGFSYLSFEFNEGASYQIPDDNLHRRRD